MQNLLRKGPKIN